MLPLSFPNVAPPRAANDSRYIVGQDATGHWLAIDVAHRSGGLFKSRADAVHYAAFETGKRPDDVNVSPLPLRMEF